MAGTIHGHHHRLQPPTIRLNGVRPRWPEQFPEGLDCGADMVVSMESGLDGRNNRGMT